MCFEINQIVSAWKSKEGENQRGGWLTRIDYHSSRAALRCANGRTDRHGMRMLSAGRRTRRNDGRRCQDRLQLRRGSGDDGTRATRELPLRGEGERGLTCPAAHRFAASKVPVFDRPPHEYEAQVPEISASE